MTPPPPLGGAVIPSVTMTRDSLRCLCDVLLNDLCNKAIFEMANTAISRLAVVQVYIHTLINTYTFSCLRSPVSLFLPALTLSTSPLP